MTPSNAGSRNTLITWAVTASVLGFGSLIWAAISYTQASKAQDDYRTLVQKYGDVVSAADLTSTDVTGLKDVRSDADRALPANLPLLKVALRRTDALTTLIGGAGATDDKLVATQAKDAIAAAKTSAGASAPMIQETSLVDAVKSMGTYVGTLNDQNKKLADDLASARKDTLAAVAEKGVVVTTTDAKVATAEEQAKASQADATAYRASADTQLGGVQGELVKVNTQLVQSTEQSQGRIATLQQQLAASKRESDDLKTQLAKYRVPTNQIVKQADGAITRVTGADRVFINLGKGDQVAAGMTFEVFDRSGVPSVAGPANDAANDKLLKGKASIEVISAQPGISECRVVRTSPGQAITEGDPIVNVVYDKNVKFKFFVYGKFNLDYRGEPTDKDTDIVKRLISGWGAQTVDKLDTKTDFVVLGNEPVVPTYTADELAREPEKAFQKEQAEQALDQYNTTLQQANQLNIPILNQTRFLYMIGYYEEAAR